MSHGEHNILCTSIQYEKGKFEALTVWYLEANQCVASYQALFLHTRYDWLSKMP